MGNTVELGKTGDLADGAMKRVVIGGQEILLARVKDKYYAIDNRCPHLGGDLSRGKLNGTVITCPRHFSQFDIVDGNVIRWTNYSGFMLSFAKMFKPPRPVQVYKVIQQGDRLTIEI